VCYTCNWSCSGYRSLLRVTWLGTCYQDVLESLRASVQCRKHGLRCAKEAAEAASCFLKLLGEQLSQSTAGFRQEVLMLQLLECIHADKGSQSGMQAARQ
jgi:hypothetical protein